MNGRGRPLANGQPSVDLINEPTQILGQESDIRRDSVITTARVAGQTVRVDLEQVTRRNIRECFLEALAITWERRAATFEAARPRPGDFNGAATRAELAERDRRCKQAADACRAKAEAVRRGWDS